MVETQAKGSSLDEHAIREFLATDYPRVVAALTLVSGSRAAAEDAVQEALARAWERSERGERFDSLRAWVMVVAMNLVRSGFRRLRAERRAGDRLTRRAELAAARSPFAVMEDREDIRRALAVLPRRQREATVLRYYLDLDVAEVAGALQINEGTAKTTLFRARRAMAKALGEADESEEESQQEANDSAGR